MRSRKTRPMWRVSGIALAVTLAQTAIAQDAGLEEVIITGTRLSDRSAADSPVPVDVITGTEMRANGSTDLQDMLRTQVPSFDVNAQPISDAATITRPPNLRGLSPDNVLVLVNGKRRHRGSIISFLGGGISDGAQGVDIASIPSLALKQVEVLRDGASSQYGSDAIAGVLNFILRDDAEGFEVVARYGSSYEGDGDNYNIAANLGLPLGDSGFINITGEIRDVEGTVRSVVRNDVAFAEANGITFPLLSDVHREAVEAYGVALGDFVIPGYTVAQRSVFVVETDGSIGYAWVADNPGLEPDYDAVMTHCESP